MSKLTFLIAEKSYLVRKGLVSMILEFPQVKSVQEVDDESILVESMKNGTYDILIINPGILDKIGIPEIGKINQRSDKVLIIGLLSSDIDKKHLTFFSEVFYIDENKSHLVKKLEGIFSQILKLQPQISQMHELSKREKNILRHIALGYTNREIGEKLFISTHTVVTHRKNITKKLGIKTVAGLTVYAIFNKLIGMDEIRL